MAIWVRRPETTCPVTCRQKWAEKYCLRPYPGRDSCVARRERRYPHAMIGEHAELGFNKLRHARASLRPDLGQEDLEVFLDQLMQGRLFRAPLSVVNRYCNRCMHGAHGP